MSRKIPLPRGWNRRTKAAIVQILALSHYRFTALVARAENERSRRIRLRAEIDRFAELISDRVDPALGSGGVSVTDWPTKRSAASSLRSKS